MVGIRQEPKNLDDLKDCPINTYKDGENKVFEMIADDGDSILDKFIVMPEVRIKNMSKGTLSRYRKKLMRLRNTYRFRGEVLRAMDATYWTVRRAWENLDG